MKIPITKPCFNEDERTAILKPLETGWVVQGPQVAEFERLVTAYTGIGHALATTSCTTALHLALVALGVEAGAEVIIPAFTFVATANVVEYQQAKPVLVDIDLSTFNIDVAQIESRLTERTQALMPVSLFGLSADMTPIVALARRHNLQVIEDAACAIGAWYHGQHAGALADAGCLSFHPRKAITTGEGGMLLCDDPALAARVSSLRDHGATKTDLQRHQAKGGFLMPEYPMVGYNYRMTDVQGAMGVAQMGKLRYILEQRSLKAQRYDQALRGLDWLATPHTPAGYVHGYQSYVCLFRPEAPTLANIDRLHAQRNALMEKLEARGIATRQGTQAVHTLDYYRHKYGLKPEDFPNAYIAERLSLALPLYAQMTQAEQEWVCQSLREVFCAQVMGGQTRP